MNMKLTEEYTVHCCSGWVYVAQSRHDALDKLLTHISACHPDEYKKLERKGRLEARSQNGCGYWDSDSSNGWDKAQASFRRAWIRTALDYKLKSP